MKDNKPNIIPLALGEDDEEIVQDVIHRFQPQELTELIDLLRQGVGDNDDDHQLVINVKQARLLADLSQLGCAVLGGYSAKQVGSMGVKVITGSGAKSLFEVLGLAGLPGLGPDDGEDCDCPACSDAALMGDHSEAADELDAAIEDMMDKDEEDKED